MESIDVKSELEALVSSGALFFVMITKVGCHPCKIAEPEVREYLRLVEVPFFDFDMYSEIGADLCDTARTEGDEQIAGLHKVIEEYREIFHLGAVVGFTLAVGEDVIYQGAA
jgi:hypothetical protein